MTTPTEHLEDAQKLEADGRVALYEVVLNTGAVVRFTNVGPLTWQGNEYDGMFAQMSEEFRKTSGEFSRPTMTIMNPGGIFKPAVGQGVLDGATVVRKKVLRRHIDNNNNIAETNIWFIGRVVSVTNQQITVELRDFSDGPNAKIPHRTFSPPEFPSVSI